MSDSRMMAAADTLKALRDEKVELQAKMTPADLVPIMPIDNNLAPEHKSITATLRKDALF